jgi:hypothetical protein
MAKGQYLSPYQQGIVKRFYEHRSTVLVGKLAELVSELYLAASEKDRAKLWKAARETLRKAGVPDADADPLCEQRRLEDLAGVVAAFQRPAPRGGQAPSGGQGQPGASQGGGPGRRSARPAPDADDF